MEHTSIGRRVLAAALAAALLATGVISPGLAQVTVATSITLPEGAQCARPSTPATMSFQGQQVTYTCSDPSVVVLGTPTVQGTTMTLVQGTVTNAAVTAANTRTLNITRVNLEDGTVCGPATGAAITVGGERMNFTCGDPSVGLIGDIDTSPPLWSTDKVVLGANQAVQSTEQVEILNTQTAAGTQPGPTPLPTENATDIQLPSGALCEWAGSGATASFNGQRVNYNCGPASNNGMNVILGQPTFSNGVWTVTTGIVDQSSSGPTLRSSQTITMVIESVELVDDTDCELATGSVVTVENQPLTYTCGRAEEGLLGTFNTTNPLWTTEKVIIQQSGTTITVVERETLGISTAIGVSGPAPSGQATSITLPDGTLCQFAGSSTLTFQGQPVTYTCANPAVVILGTPVLQNGVWVVMQGAVQNTASGPAVVSSTRVEMDIARVNLLDGMSCAFAGRGATIAVNGQRVNYTCADPSVVLTGDFNTSQPLWTANRVVLQQPAGTGTPTAQSTSTVGIGAAIGGTPTTAVPTPTPPPVGQAAPPQTKDERYFNETGFRIGTDAFWNFFNSRGGVETFGFPVSRVFGFLGCPVQIFQRLIMQQCGDAAPVGLLNLLDPGLFPYTKVNGSTFPPPDDSVKNATPPVSAPNYDQLILQFVDTVVPDTYQGQPVAFNETFGETGGLEIWGAPISNPAFDPNNQNFVYQRFQRGIMHYTTGQGTRGVLLADYLKAIMLGPDQAAQKGASYPADLLAESRSSSLFTQYCPTSPLWVCRPQDMSGSDLTYAFESG